jgi:hypothetical protein
MLEPGCVERTSMLSVGSGRRNEGEGGRREREREKRKKYLGLHDS